MTATGITSPEAWRLTVGEVAEEAGVAASAVRFYDEHGVVESVRTASNQRRFDASAGCRIKVAQLAQRIGLTVREIAELYSDLPQDPTPGDWGRIGRRLVTEAERRVAALRATVDAMSEGSARLCETEERIEAGRSASAHA